MIEIVAATKRHCKRLAKTGLRAADIIECRATGSSPREALFKSWEASSHCWAAVDGDQVISVFGVAPHDTNPNLGIPWLLASVSIYEHVKPLMKLAPVYVDRMLRKYDRLANVVHTDNRKSIAWLRHLGFTVSTDARPYGKKGELFHIFTRTN